jgi:hypothetical protein
MADARHAVIAGRAGFRCEYCRLREADDGLGFHIEHIVARKHGGSDDLENLALACQFCNLHKGPNLSGIDPSSGTIVELFHPRQDTWHNHFSVKNFQIVGATARGRASIRVLAMNDPERIRLREILDWSPW